MLFSINKLKQRQVKLIQLVLIILWKFRFYGTPKCITHMYFLEILFVDFRLMTAP